MFIVTSCLVLMFMRKADSYGNCLVDLVKNRMMLHTPFQWEILFPVLLQSAVVFHTAKFIKGQSVEMIRFHYLPEIILEFHYGYFAFKTKAVFPNKRCNSAFCVLLSRPKLPE